jgi:MFS family permease
LNTTVDEDRSSILTHDKSLFASLKVRDYLFLWVGMIGSAFAMNMQIVAQGWLVYEMSGSAINLAWVTLASTLPQFLFSLPGGVLADRFKKKPIIGLAPIINGVISVLMAVIIFNGHVTFWDFVWVGFLNGTVMSLSIPARTALIPEVVGERLMFNAMAFNTAAWNLSRILGPALAGFLIAMLADGDTTSSFGVGMVYVILSGLYLVSGFTVMLIHHKGEPTPAKVSSAFADIGECLVYVYRSRVVGGLILLSIMPFMFGMSINTLLPAFNRDVLLGGPDVLGLLMTGMGVGAIIGSLLLAKLGSLRHKGYWVLATSALWGLSVAWFASTSTFVLAFIAIAVIGFVSSINMSMNRSLVQLQVDQVMRGRVMSIDMMSHGFMPLGVLPIGYVAETVSVQAGLLMSGLILFATSILLGLAMRGVRGIDTGYRQS